MKKTQRFVTAAIFAALILIVIMFVPPVTLPNGYANLGDCLILVAACLLGCKYGAFAGAVGASLADIMLGFAMYAPATFVIKALMALTAATVFFRFKDKRYSILGVAIGGLLAELIMVLGYALYESFLYGIGGAIASVAGNLFQGSINWVAAIIIMASFSKSRYIQQYFSKIDKK